MNREDKIKQIISSLPEKPGVYQHLNEEGDIIYVGKAKNLKKRVSSYFQKVHESYKTRQHVKHIYDIKYIVVESEQDAFLLENNLIKKYQPRYNILLKDGKSYPSICITKEEYPRIYKTRNIDKKAGEYFGPYSYGNTVDLIIELIHELYPLRTCRLPLTKTGIENGKYKLCLKYHIKHCCGVCNEKVSHETYLSYIDDVKKIIRGNAQDIQKNMLDEMAILSKEMRFEEAQEIKKKYDIIEKFKSKTIITTTRLRDTDVFGYIEDEDNIFISMLCIRRGSIISGDVIEVERQAEESKEEILSYAILKLREKLESQSTDIIVPFHPYFSVDNLHYIIPDKSGDDKKLLSLAMLNAKEHKMEKQRQKDKLNPDQKGIKILEQLQKTLGLEKLPVWIESFDNSNIQGTDAVAACVVYKMGKPSKADYRHFSIKTVTGADDYASMREIAYRRYKRLKEEGNGYPDLILADGGKGQMECIREAVEDQLGLSIPIAGMVKDNKHRTRGLIYGFPGKEVGLSGKDELFYFLTRIQDEVHRFAISYHRKKRSNSQIESELDQIKGIGEKTKEELLRHFKSIKRIKEAEKSEIIKIAGNSRGSIIYEHFHGKISSSESNKQQETE